MGRGEKNSLARPSALPNAYVEDLLNAADDGALVLDEEWRIVFANARAISELCAGPLVGRIIWEAFPESVGSDFELSYRRAAKTKTAQTFEALYEPLQSWYEVRAIPVRSRLVILFRNITSQHAAIERAVRVSNERYQLAAKATNDPIWDWDLQTGQIRWSQAIVRLTGEEPEGALDWWANRVHPDDRNRILGSLERFLTSQGEHWQGEYRFRRRDGSYANILDRGYLIREDGEPMRMVGAMSDLTERVRAQARINELQSALIHATRVTTIGTMASALAHELNQPLAAAGNYTSAAMLLLAGSDNAKAARASEVIGKATTEVRRAGEIIRRLRRMVERREAEMKPAGLSALIGEAVVLAVPKPTLAELSVTLHVPAELRVLADPVQVQQVLINLVRNAVDAMSGCPTRQLTISAIERSDDVVVRVADTGIGILPEQRDKLFTAFATTKDDGLGVGLSICRTIVEAHGGQLWAEDQAVGTAFFFTLRKPLS